MSLTEDELKAAAATAKESVDDGDRGDALDPSLLEDGDDLTNVDAPKEAPKKEPVKEEKKPAEKEPVADPEADLEVDPTVDPDASTAKPHDQKMIPRARLNEARERQKAAEARAAELEAKLEELSKAAPQNKAFEQFVERVNNLYEKVEEARAEGNYKDAAKLQRELDELRDSASRQRQEYISQQAALRAQETLAFNALVDQVETLAPELNPRHDEFDPDLMEDVNSLTRALETQGKDSQTALKQAVKAMLGRDIFAKPNLRETTAPKKTTDVAKNVAAEKKTPPQIDTAPDKEQTRIDVSKLSREEYDKLPAATKARLRGDFL